MKKVQIVLIAAAVLLVAGLGAVGIAAARDSQLACPNCGARGLMMSDGDEGPLHDYMIAAFSKALGLDAAALEARLEAGESLYQIALSEGVTADEFPAWLTEARGQALQAAVEAGVLTQEQADWMLQHGRGTGSGMGRMRGGRYGDGPGRGTGPCSGLRTQPSQANP
jgi:hypothetical protein